jgi:hypothetical protein
VTHLRRFNKKEFHGTIELQLSYRKPSAVTMNLEPSPSR